MGDLQTLNISLLLCHGNEDYGIVGLDPNRTLTVNSDPIVEPDVLFDIFRFKCTGCHIFDRVYIMYCPLGISTQHFIDVIENIVKGALAPDGILFTPKYQRAEFNELMDSLGFYHVPYTPQFPAPHSTEDTNVLGKPMNYKLHGSSKKDIRYMKFKMDRELSLSAYRLK